MKLVNTWMLMPLARVSSTWSSGPISQTRGPHDLRRSCKGGVLVSALRV